MSKIWEFAFDTLGKLHTTAVTRYVVMEHPLRRRSTQRQKKTSNLPLFHHLRAFGIPTGVQEVDLLFAALELLAILDNIKNMRKSTDTS